jgi:hypothetical protein
LIFLSAIFFEVLLMTLIATWLSFGYVAWVVAHLLVLIALAYYFSSYIGIQVNRVYEKRGMMEPQKAPEWLGPTLFVAFNLAKFWLDDLPKSTGMLFGTLLLWSMLAFATPFCVRIFIVSLYRARLHWTMPEGIVAEPLPPLPQKKNG